MQKFTHIPPDSLKQIDTINQFEAIFEYATECIIVVNNEGIIEKINPSGERLFGFDKAELIGEKVEKLIPKRFQRPHVHHRETYAQTPHHRNMGMGMNLYGLKKDGTEFPIEISLSPFKSNKDQYYITFIVDITQRKVIEDKEDNYRRELEKEVENRTLVLKEAIRKLEKTKHELDDALTREKELNAMKSRFISIASHEFRTPLSTILSSLNLVEKYVREEFAEKREKHISRIKNSIKLLTEILNDILSVNKLEEGKVVVKSAEFSLPEFINECITEVGGILKNGQQIVVEKIGEGPDNVEQDPKLVRHIVVNLLTNAVKFSGEDTQITIRWQTTQDTLTITVIDLGIGIPKHNQQQLFNRFFRADNVEQIQGTGLGLSIVAQYTHLLQGHVTFKSEEGKGSEFTVTLPRILRDN